MAVAPPPLVGLGAGAIAMPGFACACDPLGGITAGVREPAATGVAAAGAPGLGNAAKFAGEPPAGNGTWELATYVMTPPPAAAPPVEGVARGADCASAIAGR